MTISFDTRQAVANGVRALDERGPAEWRSKINAGTLCLTNGQRCVLGQVYGEYDAGLTALYGYDPMKLSRAQPDVFDAAMSDGFNIIDHAHNYVTTSDELQRAWIDELTEDA